MEELNLDEMRSQIAILKEKVDKQSVVNEHLIHKVINSRTGDIRRKLMVSVFCGLIVVLIGPYAFHHVLGVSWPFILLTDAFMLYCMCMEFYYKRMITDKAMMCGSLLEVAQRMSGFKSGYKRYTLINIFVLLPIWVIWLLVEVYFHFQNDPELFWSYASGLGIGLVVGGFVGLCLYFRIIDNAEKIIRDIQE